MASITLKNIVKRYGENTVIPDLSFEIKDKEFMILVGPSGCGKSTTLRMIAGLESISAGELWIGDRCVNKVPPKDRDIAMVFQSYALYPHMTVYKNMAFALQLRKIPKNEIDRKVKEAARMLDIEQYLSRKPKALSGGQRQRVALGRAMVRDPQVFLLDEPLSNLDAKLRTEMRAQIIELHRKLGTTFVYVTHDQTEAMTMADRIAVMKDGILQQLDTPEALYHTPRNQFVAGFIGSPRMNFLTAEVTKHHSGYALKLEDTLLPIPPGKQPGKLGEYLGREVIFGIRPEDIRGEQPFVEGCQAAFEAKVTLSEMMGAEVYLHFPLFGQKLIARLPSRIHHADPTRIPLAFDMQKMHLFDAKTGDSIR